MPAVEKKPKDAHVDPVKPTQTAPAAVQKPAVNVPWEALAPVPLEHVPMPLGPVPTPDKLPPEVFSDSLGHYADAGFQPMKPAEPVSREKKIESYEQTLDGANYVQQHLQGQQKVDYLEDRLGALAQFRPRRKQPGVRCGVLRHDLHLRAGAEITLHRQFRHPAGQSFLQKETRRFIRRVIAQRSLPEFPLDFGQPSGGQLRLTNGRAAS